MQLLVAQLRQGKCSSGKANAALRALNSAVLAELPPPETTRVVYYSLLEGEDCAIQCLRLHGHSLIL